MKQKGEKPIKKKKKKKKKREKEEIRKKSCNIARIGEKNAGRGSCHWPKRGVNFPVVFWKTVVADENGERGTKRMKITFPFTFPSRRVAAAKRAGRSRFFPRIVSLWWKRRGGGVRGERKKRTFQSPKTRKKEKRKRKKEKEEEKKENGTGSLYHFVSPVKSRISLSDCFLSVLRFPHFLADSSDRRNVIRTVS